MWIPAVFTRHLISKPFKMFTLISIAIWFYIASRLPIVGRILHTRRMRAVQPKWDNQTLTTRIISYGCFVIFVWFRKFFAPCYLLHRRKQNYCWFLCKLLLYTFFCSSYGYTVSWFVSARNRLDECIFQRNGKLTEWAKWKILFGFFFLFWLFLIGIFLFWLFLLDGGQFWFCMLVIANGRKGGTKWNYV